MLYSDCSVKGQIPHGPQHMVKPKEQRGGAQTWREAMVGSDVWQQMRRNNLKGEGAWLRYFAWGRSRVDRNEDK